jgi:molecular chaperone DnaK (HSP70)
VAAAAADLNVLRLIQENAAAALMYSAERFDNETDHLALFYNLGASHL